ncbi:methyltransferase domain-containing protein [Candidatus Woesearchaeota archaeon]|nr:methyltransferase domain-containing protein [Candidatus Woesearchaeota archaeon]
MGYYDEIAKGYNELHGDEQLKKLRIIAEKLKVKKTDKLLDVGCGTGLSAKVFDCDITGIDPSEELLKQCPFKTVKACAESLPFLDNSFDIVIAVTSIHNFKDIEKGLKEIKRVGKHKFAFSVLKKSNKLELIKEIMSTCFSIDCAMNSDADLIYLYY